MNKVISAIVFLAVMMAWTPSYAVSCPATRIIALEATFTGPLGSVVIEVPSGGTVGSSYEVLARTSSTGPSPVGVVTAGVTVECNSNTAPTTLTIRQQPGTRYYLGHPDTNYCNYNRTLSVGALPTGWDVQGYYACASGSYYFTGRLY
jgi:hypothetical protein